MLLGLKDKYIHIKQFFKYNKITHFTLPSVFVLFEHNEQSLLYTGKNLQFPFILSPRPPSRKFLNIFRVLNLEIFQLFDNTSLQ